MAEFTEGVGGSRAEEDGIPGVEVLLVSTPTSHCGSFTRMGQLTKKVLGL